MHAGPSFWACNGFHHHWIPVIGSRNLQRGSHGAMAMVVQVSAYHQRCFSQPSLLCPGTSSSPPWSNSKRLGRPPTVASADMLLPDVLLASARRHAALRAAESLRKEPLFHDPYAACLAALTDEQTLAPALDESVDLGHYELATRFIDDKVLEVVKDINNQVRQVVLLTDGMDTRLYRLSWPTASCIFDVSPSTTYSVAAERLKAVGAKVARRCLSRHVPVGLSGSGNWEDKGWGDKLVRLGFRGDRPSVWTMQGLQTLTGEGLQVILKNASSMIMKDSIFTGEVSVPTLGDISEGEASVTLLGLLGSHGFDAKVIMHMDIAEGLDLENRQVVDTHIQAEGRTLLFVARQQRLSDDQVEYIRSLMEQAEEEGDEDGFEEL